MAELALGLGRDSGTAELVFELRFGELIEALTDFGFGVVMVRAELWLAEFWLVRFCCVICSAAVGLPLGLGRDCGSSDRELDLADFGFGCSVCDAVMMVREFELLWSVSIDCAPFDGIVEAAEGMREMWSVSIDCGVWTAEGLIGRGMSELCLEEFEFELLWWVSIDCGVVWTEEWLIGRGMADLGSVRIGLH